MQFVVWNDKWDDRMEKEFLNRPKELVWATIHLMTMKNQHGIVDVDTVRMTLRKLPRFASFEHQIYVDGTPPISAEELLKIIRPR